MSATDGLSDSQMSAMVYTERVNSCFSVAGILFVIFTYLFAPGFDKPINRLIFFASFGNLGSNIAALISEAGPLAGQDSPLCQVQGFLVQMFLGVDCYWACCMALNVYLVFFRDYTVERLRTLDVRYLVACYGMSFVPAIIFTFLSTPGQGRVYGPAIIWCWITTEWDWMRIVFLYGIVWVGVLLAFVVYAMAGKVIWDKRRHLDGFLNPLNEHPFANTITTETRVEITTEERPITFKEMNGARPSADAPRPSASDPSLRGVPSGAGMGLPGSDDDIEGGDYTVHVANMRQARQLPAPLRVRAATRDAARQGTNPEAWLYARVAFLFFVALLVTWVPSSVNRVYALARPGVVNFAINYVASFVFPLQGLWNFVVYCITSQTACRSLWHSCFGRRSRRMASSRGTDRFPSGPDFGGAGPKYRLNSMTSLPG